MLIAHWSIEFPVSNFKFLILNKKELKSLSRKIDQKTLVRIKKGSIRNSQQVLTLEMIIKRLIQHNVAGGLSCWENVRSFVPKLLCAN
jgi:hypothetical protein